MTDLDAMTAVLDAFADRKDGEEWETNGRRYRREGGKTRRVGRKAGGGFRVAKGALPALPPPRPAPAAVGHPGGPEDQDDLTRPGVRHSPDPTLGQRVGRRLRKLALEWVPKIRSIPSMLPAVGATVAAGVGGVVAGGTPGVMLGSVVAGGLLNKAMDRGAKRAKLARLAMARTPAERRWAAKRNASAYFAEARRLDREMVAAFGEMSYSLRVHRFAWAKGKRGGRYWLPAGKQDVPGNRLYGAKAEAAAKAAGGRGGEKTPRGGPKPGEEVRVATAKFEVARDAHRAAVQAKLPPDRVEWLRKRAEAAKADLAAKTPKTAPATRKPVGPPPARGTTGAGAPSTTGGTAMGAPKKADVAGVVERVKGLLGDRQLRVEEVQAALADLDGLSRDDARAVAVGLGYDAAKWTKRRAVKKIRDMVQGVKLSQHRADRITGEPNRANRPTPPRPGATTVAAKKAGMTVTEGLVLYERLRSAPSDQLSIAEARAEFAQLAALPGPVIDEISRRAGYTPSKTRRETLRRLQVNMEDMRLHKLAQEFVPDRPKFKPPGAEGLNPFKWLSNQYGKLRDRYGRVGAALTVAGMAAPIPGTIVAAPAAAEAVYRTRKFLGLSESA